MHVADTWVNLDAHLLRAWPLPQVAPDADKEDRGRVLVVAGSREIPGAAILAGTAALRAGAGKLVIATAQSVAAHLAIAVPEARVVALPEAAAGSFTTQAVELLVQCVESTDAVLIGPGLMDETGTDDFVAGLLPKLARAPVILDALAMNVVKLGQRPTQPLLLTPHAGEMAHLRGMSKDAVLADPELAVVVAAREWNAVVALKGAATLIATPGGERWRHEAGHPGLATSGSGDVLAGLIAGLAAQQLPLEQACAWGVVLHALAGRELARRLGPLGYLARELPAEVPRLLRRLRQAGKVRRSPRE
jgi:ADP-dependent NAD(P)H-hydrate dehydratase